MRTYEKISIPVFVDDFTIDRIGSYRGGVFVKEKMPVTKPESDEVSGWVVTPLPQATNIINIMNKARRHELKMLKYKKRLNQLRLTEGENKNFHAYRSHGAPCSCFVCSHNKYNRSKNKKDMKDPELG